MSNRWIVYLLILCCCSGWLRAAEEQLPYPKMAQTIGLMLQQFYYDHDRFHPELMVKRGLRGIESSELSVDMEWDGAEIRCNFSGEVQVLPAAKPENLLEVMAVFAQLQELILKRPEYDAEVRGGMVYAMYNGALQTLDPHTLLFPPKPASRFTDELEGEFFGIGAYLSQEDGVVRIDRVMPGRPAEKAGIRNGDRIIKVDGEKTAGLSLSESVTRIKGKRGTRVVLTIEREGVEQPFDITVTRDLVQIEVLQAYRDGDIAYLRLDEFNKNADKNLRDVLYKWERDAKNPVMGLVLDLRFNGGGRLDKAKIISDMFLSSDKEIVRTVSKGKVPVVLRSNKDDITILDVPMLVLISPSSASAAEILAGSLQQNNRAVIVGETSYGKGSVQQYRQLRNESIFKFTVQEYELRDGVSIQGVGIVPDIELLRHTVDEDGRVDLMPYTRSSEADAEFALQSHDNYKHKISHHLCWVQEYEDRESLRKHFISAGEQFSPDQEAQLAIDLLKGALAHEAADRLLTEAQGVDFFGALTLRLLKPAVEAFQQSEAQELAAALAAHGRVKKWGPPGAHAAAQQLQVDYSGPRTLLTGATEQLAFTVTNSGETEVGRLYAVIERDRDDTNSPFWEEEILIGSVPAGGSASGSIEYQVPPRLYAGQERLTVAVYQHGRPNPVTTSSALIQIENERRPHFNFSWKLQAADGRIVKDRQQKLLVTLRNDGTAASAPVTLLVSKNDNRFIQLGEGRWKLDALAPQDSVDVEVPFTVNSELHLRKGILKNNDDAIQLDLFAEERFEDNAVSQYRESIGYTFHLPLNVEITGSSHQKPHMRLKQSRVEGDQLHIEVEVDDDNLSFVTAFHNRDKVTLQTAEQIKQGVFALTLPLKKGINNIQIVARDEDELQKYLPVRYWSDHGIESRQQTAALPDVEDGKIEDIP